MRWVFGRYSQSQAMESNKFRYIIKKPEIIGLKVSNGLMTNI